MPGSKFIIQNAVSEVLCDLCLISFLDFSEFHEIRIVKK
jgi:hypothetical protein